MNANQLHKISISGTTTYIGFICCLCTLLLIATAVLFTPVSVQAEECGMWEEVSHPFGNASLSIYAKSASEAWALQYKWNEPPTPDQTTIGIWNGSIWNAHTSYTTTHGFNEVEIPKGMAVFGAGDIWVIGNQSNGPFSHGWARHWNGAQWEIYQLPSQGFLTVNAFDALTSNNIWVVGYDYAGAYSNVRLIQWNGVQWRIVNKKVFTQTMDLRDIKVLSKNNIWILGSKDKSDSSRTLAIHKDKNGWEIVPSLSPKPLDHASFRNMSIVSPQSIWAVGDYGIWPNEHKFIERWNGKKWRFMLYPETVNVSNTIAVSNSFVWANTNTGLWFWNGSEWYTTDAGLININSAIEGEAWATGYNEANEEIKIFHYASTLPPCSIP